MSPTEPLQDASEVCSINGGLVHPLWDYTPSYRALGWRELSSGDDAWTGFLLGGVLWALFPLPDLTAEAAPGSRGPTG